MKGKSTLELFMQMSLISDVKIDWKDPDLTGIWEQIARDILRTTISETGVELEHLKSDCKKREYSDARFIISYLIRKHTKLKLKVIANMIGYKNHANVHNAVRLAEGLVRWDKKFAAKIKNIELKIYN